MRAHLLDAHTALLRAVSVLREDGGIALLDGAVFVHVDRICTDLSEFVAVLRRTHDGPSPTTP